MCVLEAAECDRGVGVDRKKRVLNAFMEQEDQFGAVD